MTHNKAKVNPTFILTIALILAGGYTLVLLFMYAMQSTFIYFPSRVLTAAPSDISLEYEDVVLYTEDQVRIHGWYIPHEDARGTVLFFHGNAGNIGHRLESIRLFHQLGLNTLIIDYRGYGRSEGRPSEQGIRQDAQAAWQWLTEVQEIPPGRIVLFGRSLGGGVAAWLASRVQAGGLVLESTFTSAVDLGAEMYPFLPVRRLMHIRYPVLEHVRTAAMPVLVIHSPDDEIIPWHHGKTLYEQAAEPKHWLQISGGHNDGFLLSGRTYTEGWEQFLATLWP